MVNYKILQSSNPIKFCIEEGVPTHKCNFTEDSEERSAMDNETIVMVMLIKFSICGTIGNTLVLCAYFKNSQGLTSTFFIKALATADLLTCLVTVPFTVYAAYTDHYLRYDAVCKFYQFLLTSTVPFSSFLMVTIACDRYAKICHPLLHVVTLHRAKIIVVVLTFCAMTQGTIVSLGHGVWQFDPGVSNSSLSELKTLNLSASDRAYVEHAVSTISPEWVYDGFCSVNDMVISSDFMVVYSHIYSSMFAISSILVVVIYVVVFVTILLSRRTNLNMNISERMNKIHTKNVRIALKLAIVAVIFIVSFLPACLMASRLIPYNMIVFYMYFIYHVLNPVAYSFVSADFRGRVLKLCSCKCNANK